MDHPSNLSQSTYTGDSISPTVETLDLQQSSHHFQLFTPWTITGLLIIILSNILLYQAQWQKNQVQATLQTKPTPVYLSPLIQLQSLSLLKSTTQNPAKPSNISVVRPTLSSDLLPSLPLSKNGVKPLSPSNNGAQQLTPKYLLATVETLPSKTTEQQQIAQEVPSQTKVPTVKTQPTPDLSIQRAIEQNRLEAEQKNPLGFNHKTRAKIQAIKNNQDPNEVIRIMQQLQQQRLNQLPQR